MYFFRRKEKRTPKIEQSVRFRTPSFFIHQLIFKHLNLWHGFCYMNSKNDTIMKTNKLIALAVTLATTLNLLAKTTTHVRPITLARAQSVNTP